MPKAVINTKGGATVTLEGSQEEVAALLARFQGGNEAESATTRRRTSSGTKSRPTLTGFIAELVAGGFFSKPKLLGDVKLALEEQGHFYPATTLSPIMLRFVRRKELRRIKGKKGWMYVR
jgi:hypothetical protein